MKDENSDYYARRSGVLLYRTVSGNVFDRILHARTESNPLHVGTILLITKIWDAINDPIIGALIDARKSTKGGRFIPWIKAFSIPMAIMCVIGFLDVSSFDYKLKLIYILVTYVLYEALYTCVNVPFGSLSSVMTDDVNHRTDLSRYRSLGGTIFMTVVVIAGPLVFI